MNTVAKKIIREAILDIKKHHRELAAQNIPAEREATNLAFARSLELTDAEVSELLAWDLEHWRDAEQRRYETDRHLCGEDYRPGPFDRESIKWPWAETSEREAALGIAAGLYADRRPRTHH